MIISTFLLPSPFVNMNVCDLFDGTRTKKTILSEILVERNCKLSLSSISKESSDEILPTNTTLTY